MYGCEYWVGCCRVGVPCADDLGVEGFETAEGVVGGVVWVGVFVSFLFPSSLVSLLHVFFALCVLHVVLLLFL